MLYGLLNPEGGAGFPSLGVGDDLVNVTVNGREAWAGGLEIHLGCRADFFITVQKW